MRRNIIQTIRQMSFTWKKRAVFQGAGSAAYSITRVDGKIERKRCCRNNLCLTLSNAQLSELLPPKGDVYGKETWASASYYI